MNNFKKIISGLLIGLILYPQVSLLNINKAEAVLGVGDVTAVTDIGTTNPLTIKGHIEGTLNTIGAKVRTYITSVDWAAKILKLAKDIAYAAFKSAVLDRLVAALIAWINNDGKGSIVNNWEQFFEDAKNIAGGEFARGLSGGMLCSPFNLQVQLTLMPVNTFDSVTCTLNDVIGNIDSFMGDFRNGSWLAYQEVWYPRNNFYGATIIGLDELAKAQYAGLEAKKSEAQAGQGFLSFEDCKMVPNPKGNYTKEGDDIAAIQARTAASGAAVSAYTGPRYAKDCRVATPGLIAAEATTQVLVDIPIVNLIHTKDLTGYLTAIYNAAVNRLTKAAKEGIGGLIADATKNTKINPLFPCAGLTGDSFTTCMASVNSEKSEVANLQTGTETIGSTTLDIRHQVSDKLTQAIALQNSFVDSLTQLAACQNQASTPEIITEQDILTSLLDKFDSNQTFLDSLITPPVSGTTASNSVTPDQLAQLGQLAAAAAASANNASDAQLALNDAETQLNEIQAKVEAQLPGIQIQLDACPKLQLILPTL